MHGSFEVVDIVGFLHFTPKLSSLA